MLSGSSEEIRFGIRPVSAETHTLCLGLDGMQCLVKATDFIEKYDYESAVAVLRLAVLRSGGRIETLEALVGFLMEVYGSYDEVIEILQSPGGSAARSAFLDNAMALSLYRLARYNDALPYFEGRVGREGSSGQEQQILGHILLELGRSAEALILLESAAKSLVGDGQLSRLLLRARETVGKDVSTRVVEARRAFEAGELESARTLLETDASGDPQARLLLGEIREAESVLAIKEAREKGRAAMVDGIVAEAIAAWRDLLQLDGEDEEAQTSLEDLRLQSQRQAFEAHIAKARDVLVRDDLPGAFRALHRALTVEGGRGWIQGEEPEGLVQLLIEYVDSGVRNPERGFSGLAKLDHAERLFRDGKAEEALRTARAVEGELPGFQRASALVQRLESGVLAARGARAEKAYKAGISLEKAGMFEDAIRAFDEAIRIGGGAYRDGLDRRDRIARTQAEEAGLAKLESRISDHLEAGEPFQALRVLARLTTEFAGKGVGSDWDERIRKALEELHPIEIVESSNRKAGLIASFDGDEGAAEVHVSPCGEGWVVHGGGAFALLDSKRLHWRKGHRIFQPTDGMPEGSLFFSEDSASVRVLWWDATSRRLARLRLEKGDLHWESMAILPEEFGGARKDGTPRFSFAAGWEMGVLLALELVEGRGRKEAVLHQISTDDGLVRKSDRFPAGLFHLCPFWGTKDFVVSRAFEPEQRMLPGWFHAAVLDERGRLTERWSLEDFDQEVYAVRGASLSGRTGWIYGQYWYLDPYSGGPGGDGNAVFVLKADRSLFFHTRETELLLGHGRKANGLFRLVATDDGDRLLWPWKDEAGHEGIAVIDGEAMRLCGHLGLDDGCHLKEIIVDAQGGEAFSLYLNDEGALRMECCDTSAAKAV